MRFFTAAAITVGAFAASVLALENPIIAPDASVPIVAGEVCLITWSPTTKGPITLTLKDGDAKDLKNVEVIVKDVDNSGTYSWMVPDTLPAGTYAIAINDGDDVNYTPQFKIDSDVTASAYPSSSASASASESASAYPSASKTESSASGYPTITSKPYPTTSSNDSSYGGSNKTTTKTGATKTPTSGPKPSSSGPAPEDNTSSAMRLGSSLLVVGAFVAAAMFLN